MLTEGRQAVGCLAGLCAVRSASTAVCRLQDRWCAVGCDEAVCCGALSSVVLAQHQWQGFVKGSGVHHGMSDGWMATWKPRTGWQAPE